MVLDKVRSLLRLRGGEEPAAAHGGEEGLVEGIAKLPQVVLDTRNIHQFLSTHVSPAMEKAFNRSKLEAGARRQEVTVMFVDIRGFTSLSERLPAEEVAGLLNFFYKLCTHVILKNGGTVDKFIGDAVVALFNAPVPMKDHAAKAVEAAIEIQMRLARVNKELGKRGQELHLGIGINTGEAVVGFVGAHQNVDYTAIGDTVNVASRITDMAPPDAIVITPHTYTHVRGRVDVASSAVVKVKGRTKPLAVYLLKY